MKKLIWLLTLLSAAVVVIPSFGETGISSRATSTDCHYDAAVHSYFPVTRGSKWTYQASGGSNYVESVEITDCSPDAFSSKTTQSAFPGYSVHDYILSDSAWDVAKITQIDMSGKMTVKVTFSPPFQFMPSQWKIGIQEKKKLTVTTDIIQSGRNTLDRWSNEIIVIGFETVTVPAGTFNNALKISSNLQTSRFTTRSTVWFAQGVGLVKAVNESSIESQSFIKELTTYTIQPDRGLGSGTQ